MKEPKALVKDYMTKDVVTISPDTKTKEVMNLMKETRHNGFPIEDENGRIVGIISAFDFIIKEHTEFIKDIMTTNVVVANEKLSINDASRVMFRKGISRMPVVNDEGKLVGIITNTDMVRSHIERSTPNKVKYFKNTLEQLYDINTTEKHVLVATDKIRPTQDKIYADELEGRSYELKRGLAEPAIVVKTGNRYILIDGHHRCVAAKKLGYKQIDSYLIELDKDIKLGMEKTADNAGIKTFDDIHIIDDVSHPLIALTQSIQESKKSD